MENKNLLIIAAVGLAALGAYIAFGGKGKRFFVPGVGYVEESELPNYGYTKVGEQWFSQSQIDAATAAAGGTVGDNLIPGTAIFNSVMNILASLMPLATTVYNLVVTSTNRTQAIQSILTKYTDPASPDYMGGTFAYTQQDLQALSNADLQTILDYGYISGIYSCSSAAAALRIG